MTFWRLHYQPVLSGEMQETIEKNYLGWGAQARFAKTPTPNIVLWDTTHHYVQNIADFLNAKGFDVIAIQREEGVPW